MDRIIDMAADKIFYYFGGLAIALIVSLLLIFKSEVPQSYTIPIAVASGVFIIVPIIIFIIISIKKDDRGKFLGILLNIWSIIIVVFGTIFQIVILLTFFIIYIIYCMGTKTKPSFNPLASTKSSKSPKSKKSTEVTTPIETPKPDRYYCKYCGSSSSSISWLTRDLCFNNPHGKNHVPYEGSEKSKYYCMYCGVSYVSISSLTANSCSRNPIGKYHVPYEGDEKSKYECKYCGSLSSSISRLTEESCSKNPHGKYHEPL